MATGRTSHRARRPILRPGARFREPSNNSKFTTSASRRLGYTQQRRRSPEPLRQIKFPSREKPLLTPVTGSTSKPSLELKSALSKLDLSNPVQQHRTRSTLTEIENIINSRRVDSSTAGALDRLASGLTRELMHQRINPSGDGRRLVMHGSLAAGGNVTLRADITSFGHDAARLGRIAQKLQGPSSNADAVLLENLCLLSKYYRALRAKYPMSEATERTFQTARRQMVDALSESQGQLKSRLRTCALEEMTRLIPGESSVPKTTPPREEKREPRRVPQPSAPRTREEPKTPEPRTPERKDPPSRPTVREESRERPQPEEPRRRAEPSTLLASLSEHNRDSRRLDAASAREDLTQVQAVLASGKGGGIAARLAAQSAALTNRLMRRRIQPSARYDKFMVHGENGPSGNNTLRADVEQFGRDAEILGQIARSAPAQSDIIGRTLMGNLRLLAKYYSVIGSNYRISRETQQVFDDARIRLISALPANYRAIGQQLRAKSLSELARLIPESGAPSLNPNRHIYEVDDMVTDPTVEARIRKVQPACVKVRNHWGNSWGSGVNVSPDGTIITNYHVISGIGRNGIYVEFPNGKVYHGRLVAIDRKRDLAVIDINDQKKLPYAPLSDSSASPGLDIVVIGNPGNDPQGQPFDVQTGEIDRVTNGGWTIDGQRVAGVIFDIRSVYPGHSGSPVFNEEGEVVALVQSMNELNGDGYAVRHKHLLNILSESGLSYWAVRNRG